VRGTAAHVRIALGSRADATTATLVVSQQDLYDTALHWFELPRPIGTLISIREGGCGGTTIFRRDAEPTAASVLEAVGVPA
jgi:hypothetical protein